MILNTFFKKHNIVLDTEEKSMFGRRVSSCYRALCKDEVKFVSIKFILFFFKNELFIFLYDL